MAGKHTESSHPVSFQLKVTIQNAQYYTTSSVTINQDVVNKQMDNLIQLTGKPETAV
jgi:hypothetical protein